MYGSTGQRPNILRLASIACVLILILWVLVPHPLAPFTVFAGTLALLIALLRPFTAVVCFVALSLFRLPDAIPLLQPLRLPLALGVLAVATLIWNVAARRVVSTRWQPELRLFALFFALVTAGVPFAADRATALQTWSEVYVKIGAMTLAIAWLTQESSDFRTAARVFIFSGLVIATVALHNAALGLNLVEGTRVTIGDSVTSVLSDPNDLALILLFPLSFAIATLRSAPNTSDRILGAIAAPLLIAAIIATQSRGGLLGAVAVIGVFAHRRVRSRVAVSIALILVAVVLYEAMDISDRRSGGAAEAMIDESANGRLVAWSAALKMAMAHPLNGVGLNNFAPSFWDYSDTFVGRDLAPHSTWFGVLGETGFVGLIVFVAMVAAVIRSARASENCLRGLRGETHMRAFGTALVASLWGFCVSGSFLTQGFSWPLYILIGLTAALASYAERRSREERSSGSRLSASM